MPRVPDRLPMPEEAALTDDQRAARDLISSGPRGGIMGPFIPLLRAPELMTRVQRVGEYLRFDGTLDPDLRELVVLDTAQRCQNAFEWEFHLPIALDCGLPESVVRELVQGRALTSGRPEIRVLWALLDELHRDADVSDATYSAATALLDERQLVEAVACSGYYTMLAMVMNMARTPAPADADAEHTR